MTGIPGIPALPGPFTSPIDQDTLRRLQDAALRKLADGKDPVLAEMAREVRAGRLTLREAATSSAYRDAFAATGSDIVRATRGMSEQELRQAAEATPADDVLAHLDGNDAPSPDDAGTEESATRTAGPGDADDADDGAAGDSGTVMSAPPPVERGAPRRATWKRRW
ncbi:hypothetical protein ABZ639_26830 [Saccharomonospora sp. NPDC006951]